MSTVSIEFDSLINQAYQLGATDIHIAIKNSCISFQYRRHKRYLDAFESIYQIALFEYIKYISGIELRKYQEPCSSQFSYIVCDVELFLRFALIETQNQAHGVLRILNQNHIETLEDCGFTGECIEHIRQFFKQKHGLLLFAGTTGSGKSTSMFCALNEVKTRQIITLENPVEQHYDNLIQLSSKPTQLEQYVTQILRHDPDIICIGEIRTQAELFQCLRCALTGHLVVSTIHAGSINDVLIRFMELNTSFIPLENIIYGIVHQRLYEIEGEVTLEAVFQTISS